MSWWRSSATGRTGGNRSGSAMPLALAVWLCTLPFVFLLVGPWFGLRTAITTALVLLVVIAIVCWALCKAGGMHHEVH